MDRKRRLQEVEDEFFSFRARLFEQEAQNGHLSPVALDEVPGWRPKPHLSPLDRGRLISQGPHIPELARTSAGVFRLSGRHRTPYSPHGRSVPGHW